MAILLNRRRVSLDISGRLPTGYKEVKYIRNPSTAYINLNYIPDTNTKIVCDFNYIRSENDLNRCCLFSCRSGWKTRDVSCYPKGNNVEYTQIAFGNQGFASSGGISLVQGDIHLELSKNGIVYNNQTRSFAASTFTCPGVMYLFKNSPSSSYTGYFIGNIYSFKIYDSNMLSKDLVPCINPNNVVGMYDLFNNVFLGSSDSVQFIAGPRIIKI